MPSRTPVSLFATDILGTTHADISHYHTSKHFKLVLHHTRHPSSVQNTYTLKPAVTVSVDQSEDLDSE